MKNVIMFMTAVLMVAQVGNATLTWDHQWDCDEMPGDFEGGGTLSNTIYGGAGLQTVLAAGWDPADPTNSRLQIQANPAAEGFDFTTQAGKWSDADSTIDLSYMTFAYRDGKDQLVNLVIGDSNLGWITGFKFSRLISTPIIHDIATSSNRVTHYHYAGTGQYRILYFAAGAKAGKAELYYDDGLGGGWALLMTANGYSSPTTASYLSINDPSGSMAGYYGIDKMYWTNQGATLDTVVPEPATILLLIGGGLVGLRRRKV